jgi:hypothetical protein
MQLLLLLLLLRMEKGRVDPHPRRRIVSIGEGRRTPFAAAGATSPTHDTVAAFPC